jgi:hypothetical protein
MTPQPAYLEFDLGGQPFRDKAASENAAGTRYPEFDLPFNSFARQTSRYPL